jgi:hypothetical protein
MWALACGRAWALYFRQLHSMAARSWSESFSGAIPGMSTAMRLLSGPFADVSSTPTASASAGLEMDSTNTGPGTLSGGGGGGGGGGDGSAVGDGSTASRLGNDTPPSSTTTRTPESQIADARTAEELLGCQVIQTDEGVFSAIVFSTWDNILGPVCVFNILKRPGPRLVTLCLLLKTCVLPCVFRCCCLLHY